MAGSGAGAVATASQATQGTARVVASEDAELRELSLRGLTQTHWRLGRAQWRAEGVAVKVLRADDWCALGHASGEHVQAGGSLYDFVDPAFLAAYGGKLILNVDVPGGLPWCGLPLAGSAMAGSWPEVIMCKYSLGYVTVRPSEFLNGFYTHVQPGGWWSEYAVSRRCWNAGPALSCALRRQQTNKNLSSALVRPQPVVANLSTCAVLDAYTTPEEWEYLNSLRRNASERDPGLMMDLELESNPYHVLFTSISVIVMTHYVPGLLYLYVAFAAVSEMRERRRLGTPTPRTITAVLSINAGMMLVLGPVVLVEGCFFSGNIPAYESTMLRPWLLGCGAASSTLVVHIWDNIVRSGQTSSEPGRCLTRLPWRVALAIVLVMLDIASCVFILFAVLRTRNQMLIVYVPMVFLCVEVANVLTFVWKLLALLKTVDGFLRVAGQLDSSAELGFKRRTTRAGLGGVICSLVVIFGLVMIARGWVCYSSPVGCLFVGCMIIYGKMGVAASHVKICSKRPRSQTSSVQPGSAHNSVATASGKNSAHKSVASASGKKRDIVATPAVKPAARAGP